MRRRLRAPVVLPCDPGCSVLRDAVVDVEDDGRIGYCGPVDGAPDVAGVPTTELSGILMPGLVNTHAHSPMTVLRGMGDNLPLLRWLHEVIWPAEARLRPADIRAGMLLGSIEMLRAGVTTTAEMYFRGDHVAEAVLAAGQRAVIAGAIIETPVLKWRDMLDGISAWIDADGRLLGPGDRVELAYGPHSAYTLPPEALAAAGEAALTRGALVHIHIAEAPAEDAVQRAEHGSVPALLQSLGVLDGRVLAAHSVHLSDEDIALFAANQVGVAHCPASNMKLASGISRVPQMRAAGIAVGVGTDGPASNDGLDLWQDLRLAALLARVSAMDSSALSAGDALLMATRGGAEALGRHDIGALEPGRWADLVHIDLDDPAFVAGVAVPDGQLLANLVWAAGSRRVRDVWVAGDRVVEHGETTWVDRAEAQATAGAVTRRLLAG